ncbi:MAG: hypothetical protein IKJ68_03170 [Clostridia bacterium]|nr:hypothetical protein [Clostridia bacterium]
MRKRIKDKEKTKKSVIIVLVTIVLYLVYLFFPAELEQLSFIPSVLWFGMFFALAYVKYSGNKPIEIDVSSKQINKNTETEHSVKTDNEN